VETPLDIFAGDATLIYYLVFKYVPLYNAQIAFKDFSRYSASRAAPGLASRTLSYSSSQSTLAN